MSLPPKALHCLAALKQELLSAESRKVEMLKGEKVKAAEPRRAEVESQQRMRPARRSKATIASRYYQRREWWTPVY